MAYSAWEREPVCFACNSECNVDKIISTCKELSKGEEFAQVFRYSKDIEDRLLPAFLASVMRLREKSLHTKNLCNELMTIVAKARNVSDAVKKVGIKDGRKFIILCSDETICKKFCEMTNAKLTLKIPLRLDTEVAELIAYASTANP